MIKVDYDAKELVNLIREADNLDSLKVYLDPYAGLPPIFGECLGWKGCRYQIDRPFIQAGRVYATNGRSIVWMSDDRLPLAQYERVRRLMKGRKVPPKIAMMIAGYRFDPSPLVMPGDWKEFEPCDDCKGTGLVLTRSDHGLDVGCPECEGSGKQRNRNPVKVAEDYYLAEEFLGFLTRHGATIYPPADPVNSDHPCRFTLLHDGIEGLVMPMSAEYVNSRASHPDNDDEDDDDD